MWRLKQLPFSKLLFRIRKNSTSVVFDTNRECYLSSEGDIALLNLNRPERKNAIGKVLLEQLRDALDHLSCQSKYRALILQSQVKKCFSAGADLKERAQMSPEEVEPFVDCLRSTFGRIEELSMPTIAAIDGFALGGGLEIALCCDLRYAGPAAKLGLPETKLAILPAAGGSQRLPRLIGSTRAKELIFTGRIIDSQEAKALEIVNGCAESDATALGIALETAKIIAKNGPLAVKYAKLAIDNGVRSDLPTGLMLEKLCYARLIPTSDRLEGLKAFREGREAKYQGS